MFHMDMVLALGAVAGAPAGGAQADTHSLVVVLSVQNILSGAAGGNDQADVGGVVIGATQDHFGSGLHGFHRCAEVKINGNAVDAVNGFLPDSGTGAGIGGVLDGGTIIATGIDPAGAQFPNLGSCYRLIDLQTANGEDAVIANRIDQHFQIGNIEEAVMGAGIGLHFLAEGDGAVQLFDGQGHSVAACHMVNVHIVGLAHIGDPAGGHQAMPGAIVEIKIDQGCAVALGGAGLEVNAIIGYQAHYDITGGIVAFAGIQEAQTEGLTGLDQVAVEVGAGILDHILDGVIAVFIIEAVPVGAHAPLSSLHSISVDGEVGNGEQAVITGGGDQGFHIGNVKECCVGAGVVAHVEGSDQRAIGTGQDQAHGVGAGSMLQGNAVAVAHIGDPAGGAQIVPAAIMIVDLHQCIAGLVLGDQHTDVHAVIGYQTQGDICGCIAGATGKVKADAEIAALGDQFLIEVGACVLDHIGNGAVAIFHGAFPVAAHGPQIGQGCLGIHAIVDAIIGVVGDLVAGNGEQAIALNGSNNEFQIAAVEEATAGPSLVGGLLGEQVGAILGPQAEGHSIAAGFALHGHGDLAANAVHAGGKGHDIDPIAAVVVIHLEHGFIATAGDQHAEMAVGLRIDAQVHDGGTLQVQILEFYIKGDLETLCAIDQIAVEVGAGRILCVLEYDIRARGNVLPTAAHGPFIGRRQQSGSTGHSCGSGTHRYQ